MTDVTRTNYETLIPEIIAKIQKCTFIAVDAEYTGLQHPLAKNSLFDTAPARYHKVRTGFANYSISQFGIAIFNRAWENNEYFVDAYNIHLFPVAFDTYNEEGLIHCQVESLNFLAANNFDFNKFIREGVPYLRESDKVRLRKYCQTNRQFMRWLEVRDKGYFPKFINKLDDEDIEALIDRLSGFTKVINAIMESKKPVVGHNMFMDLILIIKQFYQDLPPAYNDFKELTHRLFPTIYDSKHISANLRSDLIRNKRAHTRDSEYLYDTSLFGLYQNTGKVRDLFTPFVTPKNGGLAYKTELSVGFDTNLESIKESKTHEAGLDACITGAVFVRLAHMAARRNPTFLSHRSFPTTVAETFSNVAEWKNFVNVVRATVASIRLDGKDPTVNKPNWIRVEADPARGTELIDFQWLRTRLPKFGDVEIDAVNDKTALLACGGWSGARVVWRALEEEGYKLSAQEFPSQDEFGFGLSIWNPMFVGGGLLLGLLTFYIAKKVCA